MHALATMAMTATAAVAMTGSASADAERADAGQSGLERFGCPNGAVCVYEGHSWNNNTPEHVYETYGAHKLEGEFGNHRIFNNQHSGATAVVCVDDNGTEGCSDEVPPRDYFNMDLTPANSIRLSP